MSDPDHIAGLGNMSELMAENQVGKPGYEGHLNDRVVSLAEVLRKGGYHTYISGKWHLGHQPGTLPFDRGFERSFSMLYGGASHWADFYSSRSYADSSMQPIREDRGDGKPFLAYLAFTAVPDPMHVSWALLRRPALGIHVRSRA